MGFARVFLALFGHLLGSLESSSLIITHIHVLWLSEGVGLVLILLASVAVLSSFEVVVGARTAFPSTIWEHISTDEFLTRLLLLCLLEWYC